MNPYLSHNEIINQHEQLKNHNLYKKILTQKDLSLFMETHSFAVWDFMTLLKRLQIEMTCVTLPWSPSPYSKKLVRLINEIVLGEESDLDEKGEACDHFSLYVHAMNEIGADTKRLFNFIETLDYDSNCNIAEKNFVSFNLELSKNGKIHEVAAAFFFGREKLIPDMFTSILGDLNSNLDNKGEIKFPKLKYYLQRHIDIDGGEHSHLAYDCLQELCGDSEVKWNEAINAGIQSLKLRNELWNSVAEQIVS